MRNLGRRDGWTLRRAILVEAVDAVLARSSVVPERSGRFSTRSPGTRATLLTSFVGSDAGPWAVERIDPVVGTSLPHVAKVALIEGGGARLPPEPAWVLRGVVGHERYTTREEHEALAPRQQPLGLPTATRAALIPVTKSQAWWRLSQEKRRAILEEASHHIAIGMEYLPAVACRLHHGRDLGVPFDFLTWFEFAPEHEAAFEELVRRLRATEEWSYVVREVDIRLRREA